MAIPSGTKFHGVAPIVDTVNRGSELVNSWRDAYTLEELADAINIIIEETGVIRLVPFFQEANPGVGDTYTASNNIVDFNWVGGPGVYEFTLPSAAAIPYRKIRFVNDGTVTAQDKVHLVPPGSETIDGVSFYSINKAYNGCAVWSDGINWIVIQAKAH